MLGSDQGEPEIDNLHFSFEAKDSNVLQFKVTVSHLVLMTVVNPTEKLLK